MVLILFYERSWQGGVFKVMINDNFLVLLAISVFFPKFLERLKSAIYENCMK